MYVLELYFSYHSNVISTCIYKSISNQKTITHFFVYFFKVFKSMPAVDLFILIPLPPSLKEIKTVFGFNLVGFTIF